MIGVSNGGVSDGKALAKSLSSHNRLQAELLLTKEKGWQGGGLGAGGGRVAGLIISRDQLSRPPYDIMEVPNLNLPCRVLRDT